MPSFHNLTALPTGDYTRTERTSPVTPSSPKEGLINNSLILLVLLLLVRLVRPLCVVRLQGLSELGNRAFIHTLAS